MKNKLGILSLVLALILSVAILLPGCAASESKGTTTPTTSLTPEATSTSSQSPTPSALAASTTDFGRLLSMVPESFLQEHDIWFGDPGQALGLNGIEDINGLESVKNMPPEKRQPFIEALSGVAARTNWRNLDMAPLIGFDAWMVDRTVFTEIPPPWSFSINEGDFDEDLIKSKLIEQGYAKVEHGSNEYYSIRGDHEIDPNNQLVMMGAMASLNRIAVLDNTLVTAVTTADMTDILDAISGQGKAILDSAAGQALAGSLGGVISGVIMNPERVLNINPPQEMPPFGFAIPADWGLLHRYDMVGMGYNYAGNQRSWIISLYYQDMETALADVGELVKRLESYIFNTQILNPQFEPGRQGVSDRVPLTDKYTVGKPVVQQYPEGATLTVECRGSAWPSTLLLGLRDLLFLAPDPAPYVKQ